MLDRLRELKDRSNAPGGVVRLNTFMAQQAVEVPSLGSHLLVTQGGFSKWALTRTARSYKGFRVQCKNAAVGKVKVEVQTNADPANDEEFPGISTTAEVTHEYPIEYDEDPLPAGEEIALRILSNREGAAYTVTFEEGKKDILIIGLDK